MVQNAISAAEAIGGLHVSRIKKIQLIDRVFFRLMEEMGRHMNPEHCDELEQKIITLGMEDAKANPTQVLTLARDARVAAARAALTKKARRPKRAAKVAVPPQKPQSSNGRETFNGSSH